MFDSFQPFKVVQKQDFTFIPNRFEIWIDGEMISSGNTKTPIIAKVINQDNLEKVKITFIDNDLNNELIKENIFDEFITAKDRLQLIIIPEETNNENIGIMGFKMILGSTRKNKEFCRSEPYCCNLFLQKGSIVKVTFSFSNPEKLFEFYS